MTFLPKTPRSFEEEGKLSLADQQHRGENFRREGDVERDPETGERPGVAERVKDTVDHVAERIASHLPHAKG